MPGFVGRMCAGGRQLLCASTSGTAAMNGPKSHLKGTLCPASDTRPCCGQLRNSSSGGSGGGNKRAAWAQLWAGGREGRPTVQGSVGQCPVTAAATAGQQRSAHAHGPPGLPDTQAVPSGGQSQGHPSLRSHQTVSVTGVQAILLRFYLPPLECFPNLLRTTDRTPAMELSA